MGFRGILTPKPREAPVTTYEGIVWRLLVVERERQKMIDGVVYLKKSNTLM